MSSLGSSQLLFHTLTREQYLPAVSDARDNHNHESDDLKPGCPTQG